MSTSRRDHALVVMLMFFQVWFLEKDGPLSLACKFSFAGKLPALHVFRKDTLKNSSCQTSEADNN